MIPLLTRHCATVVSEFRVRRSSELVTSTEILVNHKVKIHITIRVVYAHLGFHFFDPEVNWVDRIRFRHSIYLVPTDNNDNFARPRVQRIRSLIPI